MKSRFFIVKDPGHVCCSICQHDINTSNDEHLQLSDCTHRFHIDCLDAWTHSDHPASRTCPLCRVPTDAQQTLLSASVKDRVRRRLDY
jgi:hypothetical protein